MSEQFSGGYIARPLSARQREILRFIIGFYRREGETPSVCFIARRLHLHHSAVQEHLAYLYRKGWLKIPAPEGLRCTHMP